VTSLYPQFAERVRNNLPVALLTVIDGPHIGATLMVVPNSPSVGTLGDLELDRVAARDAMTQSLMCQQLMALWRPQSATSA